MLKYFTVLWCRHEVCELKKTFCRNIFIKKCVFNYYYPIYIYIYIYIYIGYVYIYNTPFQIKRTCRGSMKSMKLFRKFILKCLKASANVNPCQNDFWLSDNHPQKLRHKPSSPSFNADFLSFRPARCTRQPSEPSDSVIHATIYWPTSNLLLVTSCKSLTKLCLSYEQQYVDTNIQIQNVLLCIGILIFYKIF